MKIRYRLIAFAVTVWCTQSLMAQSLTLEYCLTKATEGSSLSQQRLHYATIEEMKRRNAGNTYLPTVFVNGQASYQTDVFSFPNNPVFETPIIPKDQYRITLDVTQKIYDGGYMKNQRMAESAKTQADAQATEVDIYEIKSTVSTLYFSALMYQENIKILKNMLTVLGDQQKMIEAQVANGVVLKSAAAEFKKQVLTTEQQIMSATLEQRGLLDMLEKWIGQEITSSESLTEPTSPANNGELMMQRPELNLLSSQEAYMQSMQSLTSVKRRPQLMAVAQAAYGSPNVYNMLEVDFTDAYFVGLKLSWQLLDFGTVKNEKSVLAANQSILQAKREHVEKNFDIMLTREKTDVEKFQSMLEKDDQIVQLQSDIVASAYAQLQNGVITSTEYLLQLNAKTQAELSRQLHTIQARQAEYNCLKITGNL